MDESTLRETLEDAVMPLLDGSPFGPLLAGRIRREVMGVLQKHGLRGQVDVRDGGRQVRVDLKVGARVRAVVLTFSPH
ncbi:MAG: hypothetical protein H6734_24670 [Alphaproteobacteria bacterium]|nr:hypothetical protein [Alphaproteobacteria bacterium]